MPFVVYFKAYDSDGMSINQFIDEFLFVSIFSKQEMSINVKHYKSKRDK